MEKRMAVLQRWLGIAGIVAFALMAAYAFGMATPAAACLYYNDTINFYKDIQGYNNAILVFSIVGLLISAFYGVLRSAIRKVYYISNFIITGLLAGILAASGIDLFIGVSVYQQKYYALPFDAMNAYWKDHTQTTRINPYTPVFGLGYVLAGLLLVLSVLALISLVYKILSRIRYEKTKNQTKEA
ncbi:MAG: hypothetical protein LKM30_05700 [Bacilli bacterium]|jgi:hypothetical protein|nr:hypothetical protein [Bacilli bacterium]